MYRKPTCFLVLLLLTTVVAVAQQPKDGNPSGWYSSTSFSSGTATSSGWSGNMGSAVGYDFSRAFSAEIGTTFYPFTTEVTTDSTGATTNTMHYGSLGDAFVELKFRRPSQALGYSGSLVTTAPTGDVAAGVSTGRATVTFNNRIEHGFDHFTPFAEGSIANSITSTRQHVRQYTTLGAISEFRGGLDFDLSHNVSLTASGYGDVGYGNQKMYSKTVRPGSTNGNSKAAAHSRAYQTAFLTSGTSALVNDDGISGDLSWDPASRFNVDVSYDRSVHFATNAVAFSLGVRLGHVTAKGSKQ